MLRDCVGSAKKLRTMQVRQMGREQKLHGRMGCVDLREWSGELEIDLGSLWDGEMHVKGDADFRAVQCRVS